LHAAFATFLRWRADLLPSDFVLAFRHARENEPAARADFDYVLREELGGLGAQLAQNSGPSPCWSTRYRYAFPSTYQGRRIVVQCARAPVLEAEFQAFHSSLKTIPGARSVPILSTTVIREFREWADLADEPARERSYLEAVAEVRKQTSFLYPELIPDLCTERLLCWFCPDGEPVSQRLASADPKTSIQLAELILEQTCLLGIVDGDLDAADIVTTPDGPLAIRRWGRMMSVPPALVPVALKYVSAVLAGDSPVAGRMLIRLAVGNCPIRLESALTKVLASSEPEMKGRLRFPPSAAGFESNWRAIAALGLEAPLFLTFLHRNLNALGYWCAETSPAKQALPGGDCLAEAQFSVLGRLLRRRVGDLMSGESASEFAIGSAMLFAETLRQAARTAEDLRDNELSIGMEIAETAVDPETRNLAAHKFVSTGLLLVVFLVCVEWGRKVVAPWAGVLETVAAAAFLGLCWVVVRIG
jgi:hypothetical protein